MKNKIESYLERKVDFTKEVVLFDDGKGIYIAEWNVPEPQPTIEELETIQIVKLQYEINEEALNFLLATDWKVIRHGEQLATGLATSLTSEEYQSLLMERQEKRDAIK